MKPFSPTLRLLLISITLEFLGIGLVDSLFALNAKLVIENVFLISIAYALTQATALVTLLGVSELLKVFSPLRVVFLSKLLFLLTFTTLFAAIKLEFIALFLVGTGVMGIGFALREVGTRDYLMDHCDKTNASTVMGTAVSLRDGAWALATCASGFLVLLCIFCFASTEASALPYNYLVALIFITLSAFVIARAIKSDTDQEINKNSTKNDQLRFSWCESVSFFRLVPTLSTPVKFSMLLMFFVQILNAMIMLFLPLLALSLAMNIGQIGLLVGLVTLPMLLGSFFARFEDRGNKLTYIIIALLFSTLPLLLLSQVQAPLWIAILSALVSLSIAVVRPACLGLIAATVNHDTAPKMASLQVFCNRLGALLGSLFLGWVSAAYGIQNAFIVLAALAFGLALVALVIKIRIGEIHFQPKPLDFVMHPLHRLLHTWHR